MERDKVCLPWGCFGLWRSVGCPSTQMQTKKITQIMIINAQENGMVLLHFSQKAIMRRKAEFELVRSSAKYLLLETAINLYISL